MNKTPLVLLASLSVIVAACGRQESPPPATPAAAPAVEPPPAMVQAPAAAAPASDEGRSVYNRSCALCHAAGVGGAPKPGDAADWDERLAQGIEVVYRHAIDGFTGAKGVMPPRGGAGGLSDDQVIAAVDYMIAEGR